MHHDDNPAGRHAATSRPSKWARRWCNDVDRRRWAWPTMVIPSAYDGAFKQLNSYAQRWNSLHALWNHDQNCCRFQTHYRTHFTIISDTLSIICPRYGTIAWVDDGRVCLSLMGDTCTSNGCGIDVQLRTRCLRPTGNLLQQNPFQSLLDIGEQDQEQSKIKNTPKSRVKT